MTTSLKKFLDKLRKELYLEYYYEKPKKFPILFQSGIEVMEKQKISNSDEISITKSVVSPTFKDQEFENNKIPSIRFNTEDLVRKDKNSYIYLPKNKLYTSLFECVHELTQSFPIEEIFSSFTWQEFENFVTSALDHYGYHAFRTFRYTIRKKRHEVDVIARDNHKIFFIDAKRWTSKTASNSSLIKAAEEQYIRAIHLIQDPRISGLLLQKLKLPMNQKFKSFKIYPLILVSSNLKKNLIVNGVPILSFISFNEFLINFHKSEPNLKPLQLSKVIFQKKLN